jgi:hypothetical protein
MNEKLSEVLKNISDEYRGKISTVPGTRNYLEVNIGERAEKLGFSDLKNRYQQVNAVVPLKEDGPGMRVRIDGRTFVNYALYDSGVAVPGYVAKEAGLPYKTYVPNDSMVLNF